MAYVRGRPFIAIKATWVVDQAVAELRRVPKASEGLVRLKIDGFVLN